MRIVLSRKGFDAAAGGVANPILPSGELCCLPIPDNGADVRYDEITFGHKNLGAIVNDLTRSKISADATVHLDPDLNKESRPRSPGWKPLFGQTGAAQGHLQKQGIQAGDVFLFFGWFRQVEYVAGRYRYVKDGPDQHVIYGWLQIERIIPAADRATAPYWAQYHPHFKREKKHQNDSVYFATDCIRLPQGELPCPGAGVFRHFHPALRLTAPGKSRSIWRLPAWFHPNGRSTCLTYHSAPRRWQRQKDCTLLRSVGQGQEFVLDCEAYPEATGWVSTLLQQGLT